MGFSAHDALVLLALLVAGAGLLVLAPLLRLPYPILLVLGGLAVGFIPGIPHVALRPEVVLATMLAVAAVAHTAISGLSWPICFVLGAIVAPTDAVAATAIASRLGLPRRLVAIIEGESLINDATALVAYGFAVTAVLTGSFSFSHAAWRFVVDVVG